MHNSLERLFWVSHLELLMEKDSSASDVISSLANDLRQHFSQPYQPPLLDGAAQEYFEYWIAGAIARCNWHSVALAILATRDVSLTLDVLPSE